MDNLTRGHYEVITAAVPSTHPAPTLYPTWLRYLHGPMAAVDRRRRGLLLVAAAAITWSTGGLVVRLLDDPDPWRTIFWRSLFAILFLIGFVVARERRRSAAVVLEVGRPGVLLGVCFALASVSFVIALGLTSVANTLVILSTSPLFAALLGWIFLGDAIRARTWVAIAVTVAGVALMVSGSGATASWQGNLVALVIPIAFAVGTVVIRKNQHLNLTPAMALSPLLAMGAALFNLSSFTVDLRRLGLLAFFGCVQLGLGMALFSAGARWTTPAQATLVSLLETVLGPVWVWAALGEFPPPAALIGGTVVLTALVVHSALDLRRPLVPLVA